MTSRSPLGAVALHTGGLLVDHGWLRLLGAGCERLPGSLLSWNGYEGPAPAPQLEGALVVAHDAVGGFFVLDCGGLGTPDRSVVYAEPDTLRWVDLGGGYSDFLRWATQGDLAGFYADLRWPGWESEVATIALDRGLHFAPPLWTVEGRAARLEPSSRRPVPLHELWNMWHELRRQLGP